MLERFARNRNWAIRVEKSRVSASVRLLLRRAEPRICLTSAAQIETAESPMLGSPAQQANRVDRDHFLAAPPPFQDCRNAIWIDR